MKVGGIGTIERRGPSTWRIRLAVGKDPETGKYRQKSRTVHGSKADAFHAREELRWELEGGLRFDAERITFSQFATEFASRRKMSGTIRKSTLIGDAKLIKRLVHYFGPVQLRAIDSRYILHIQARMERDGYSQTMVHVTLRKLSQMLKEAVRLEYLLANPCDRIDIPPVPQRSLYVLDADGARRLLKEIEQREQEIAEGSLESDLCPFLEQSRLIALRLALATGMRRGEILGLNWRNIDLSNGILRVVQQYTAEGELRAPKTKSGIRTISLDPETTERLRAWREKQETWLTESGILFTVDTPVASNAHGDYSNPGNFSGWWARFRREIGFSNLRFHDLRHTQATLLIGNGIDIKTVQGRLGHSRAATTLDIYACALPENDRRAANLLGSLIDGSIQPARNALSWERGESVMRQPVESSLRSGFDIKERS